MNECNLSVLTPKRTGPRITDDREERYLLRLEAEADRGPSRAWDPLAKALETKAINVLAWFRV
jgi:hypothetical protein